MEKIILRRATPADAPKILHITRDAFEKYAAEVRRREKIAALYNLWYEQKEEALQVYTEALPQRVPLSPFLRLRAPR